MGHRVPHHASKCCNVHGHEIKVEATVSGPLVSEGTAEPDEGMVLDFGDVKAALQDIEKYLDHRFIMAASDMELATVLDLHIDDSTRFRNEIGWTYFVKGFGWIQEMQSVPTAENLAKLCFDLLSSRLNKSQTIQNPTDPALSWISTVRVESVRFWETPHSVAEYSR